MSTSKGNKKVERYTTVPLTLYRLQPKLPVNLRNYDKQMALGRTSFDLKLYDGLVLPSKGDEFTGPNGMSLRPASTYMKGLVEQYSGSPTIYALLPGLKLPDSLILVYEHSDHFSMQVREPMTLERFNQELTDFLQTLPSQTKEQFIDFMNDEDDRDG